MPRAPKKCGRTGCMERVTARTYCPTHTAEQQARANTTARGYGQHHRRASEQARVNMPDGQPCVRCHQPMHRTQHLHLDHTDDRTGYLGLAHARCNARAGGTTTRPSTPPPPF